MFQDSTVHRSYVSAVALFSIHTYIPGALIQSWISKGIICFNFISSSEHNSIFNNGLCKLCLSILIYLSNLYKTYLIIDKQGFICTCFCNNKRPVKFSHWNLTRVELYYSVPSNDALIKSFLPLQRIVKYPDVRLSSTITYIENWFLSHLKQNILDIWNTSFGAYFASGISPAMLTIRISFYIPGIN
jgi:hypothetical protein